MTAPPTLLATKLQTPPARSSERLVSRPRLFAMLEKAFAHPLTLISAPAGYGKTTLVSEFIQPFLSGPPPAQVGWLSLDADDNDAGDFLHYLLAALPARLTGAGQAALAGLQSPQPVSPKASLIALINDLNALPPNTLGWIVMDDYHTITTQPIHNALTYLLDHLPPQLRLVVITRAAPSSLPLARLRARGQLAELSANDLRFTADEAAQFLNQVMGLTLSADDVAALEQRTEGWVAGLQLAALSLQGRDDPTTFITALTGAHRHIADYLTSELYQRQSIDRQTFLLHTSILERFCAPVCQAVLGGLDLDAPGMNPLALADVQAVIESLERDNLLIQPLDVERHWWRYHSLLADMLRERLRQRWPQLEPALHARASAWFEQQGYFEEAVHHALQAGDVDAGARLVESQVPDLMKRDDFATLRRWLARLPDAVIWAHPRLCLAQIWVRLDFNQPEAATPYFERVTELLRAAPQPTLLAEALTLQAIAEAMTNHPEQALALAHQAQQLNLEGDALSRALLAYGLGAAYKMGNDGLRAEQCLREAGLAALAAGSIYLAVEALGNLGDLQVDLGRLPEAEQSLHRTLEQARTLTHVERPASGWIYWDLARIHYEWNDLETAQREAEQSAHLCAQWGNSAMQTRALLLQAQIQEARQHWLAAKARLDEAEQVAQQAEAANLRRMVMRRRFALALAQSDLPLAEWLAETLQAQTPPPLPYFQAFVMARLCLAQGQPARALDYLKQSWQALEKTNLVIGRIQSLILESLARRAMGQREQALLPLERALTLARPGGFVRSFIEHGAPMQELLRRAAANTVAPDYVQTLLATAHTSSPEPGLALTQRERQILSLLATGLSNREMADQLVITEATLKRHVSNLYLKLGVHSRAQALARATDQGFL